jgi:hypothetical protein
MSVKDPGRVPLPLGTLALLGASRHAIQAGRDDCSAQILEPDHSCSITLRFTPAAGGTTTAMLVLPSDSGTVVVPVTAVAPAVSSLLMPLPRQRVFRLTGTGSSLVQTQTRVLRFANPLGASVRIASVTLSGRRPHRFSIRSDRCAEATLAPAAACSVTVRYEPGRAGSASAVLVLRGDGPPARLVLTARQTNSPAAR